MLNMAWLAQEAQKLHQIFQGTFFALITTFILLSTVLDLLRIPIGSTPGFTQLIGRCLIATLLLIAMPEIMNIVASITDAVAKEVGDLNNFKLVLSRMGDKLKSLSWSWTSVKDMVTVTTSFLSFFILYITVYFADAAFLYSWTLIYVFSPIIFALYVLPATSGATTAMFRSMIEVSLWKIVWASMAALLWSTALSDINKPEYNIDFLTAIVLNLMLALSILITPIIVRSLLNSGISGATASMQGMVMAAATLTPSGAIARTKSLITPSAKVDGPPMKSRLRRKSDPPPNFKS